MEKLKWETKKVKVKDLIQLDINPRKISETKKQKLVESLERFNLVEIPAVNTDMQIIGGNQRVTALMLVGRGEEEIDVRVPNRKLTKKEVKEYAIISNTHAGEFDFEIMELFLEDVVMEEFIFEVPGWADHVTENSEATEDDFVVPPIDEIKTDIVLGDIFEIGEHRLVCGDSTNIDDVDKLMMGKKADMVFTDPPYGVDYSGGIQFKNGKAKTESRERLKNDKTEQIYADVIPILASITDGAIYTWFAGTKAKTIYESIENCGGQIHALIIWVKNGGYGALNANYKQKHEPCLYWKPRGGKLNFTGATTETTIWEINKDGQNKMHPTQKPVALAHKAIKNHSVGLVADLFLGSGTTMVASHQLNRKCYGMEMSPQYCQVIIDRMRKFDPTIKITKNGKAWNTTKIS